MLSAGKTGQPPMLGPPLGGNAVAVGVGLAAAATVGVLVNVRVGVAGGFGVAVAVRVLVAVGVAGGFGVAVAVRGRVAVAVRGRVAVGVGVRVAIDVHVRVGMRVGVRVAVGVQVRVECLVAVGMRPNNGRASERAGAVVAQRSVSRKSVVVPRSRIAASPRQPPSIENLGAFRRNKLARLEVAVAKPSERRFWVDDLAALPQIVAPGLTARRCRARELRRMAYRTSLRIGCAARGVVPEKAFSMAPPPAGS
jgi:hypothetical protein